jgi:hypothetical protein
VSREAMRERGAVFRQPAPGGDSVPALAAMACERHPLPERRVEGHLATHVDDLAIPGELPEDSANSQGLEPLNWSLLSACRCRRGYRRDLLFVVHARALSPRGWRPSGHGR